MENSKFRHEYKHYINMCDFIALNGKLGYIAKPDIHMKGEYYLVRSLYFDTPDDKALREKVDGIGSRDKFRLRYYDMDDSFIQLEKKSKRQGLCMKLDAPFDREKAVLLLGGEYDFLKDSPEPLRCELFARMSGELLRPRLTVDYKRIAYTYPAGNVRVTFDYEIRSGGPDEFFSPRPASVPEPGVIIMEVKYDEFLPQIIADTVQLTGRQTESFSKYAACRLAAM